SQPHALGGLQRGLQQLDPLSGPPRERVGVAEAPRMHDRKEGDIPLASKSQPALEQADRLAQFAPGDLEIGDTPAGSDQAVWVIEFLGKADAFFAIYQTFLKTSTVSQNPAQIKASYHGRKAGEAKALPPPIVSEQLQDFLEQIFGAPVVPGTEA